MFTVPSADAVAIAQTYGLWIQTGAISLSAVAAFLLILHSKKVSCRRATLDLILTEETNPTSMSARREFILLRDGGDLVNWATAANAGTTQAITIRAALNRYELVAIGLNNKIVDEDLYKEWCRSTFVKDWIACKPFVTQLRATTHNNKYFCECEKLATKWANQEERARV